MATIVYDGVGDGGNLFKGMKFFLQQRLPMRQHLIERVKSNGGEVVPLEKLATIRISDHARKDCPVGSISWTFIEKSVKNGKLEDIENHRAGPVTATARPVGSAQPTKSTRTPFTAEDDRMLMKWVVKAERKGLPIKGNEIYEQLERKNNRHTSQSWRDRWIKHVSLRPRPDIDEETSSGPDGPTPSEPKVRAPRRPEPVSRTRLPPNRRAPDGRSIKVEKDPSRSRTSARASSSESSPGPWIAKSKGGRLFTPQEIKLLIANYDDIINIDENEEINAWAAWSVTYPNHTPQEWRNYFKSQLTDIVKAQRKPESRTANRSFGSRQDSNVDLKPTDVKSSTNSELVATKKNYMATKVPAMKTKPIGENQTSTGAATSQRSHRVADPILTDEKQFEAYVKLLADELDLDIDFNPTICGKTIRLFRLWQVVKADYGGIDEVEGRNLWQEVARSLDIKDVQSRDQLRSCYNVILPDVEATRDEFWEMTDSQERAMIESQLRETIERQTDDKKQISDSDFSYEDDEEDDLNLPVLSRNKLARIPHSNKRSPPKDQHGSVNRSSQNKRQRLDKGKEKEIPSTPEEVIYRKPNRHLPESSPSKGAIASPILGENIDEDITQRSFRKSHTRKELFGERQTYSVEPETQDFLFITENGEFENVETGLFNALQSTAKQAFQIQIPVRQPQQDPGDVSPTQSETESEDTIKMTAFIERCRSKGHSDENIQKCMYATSWETAMADNVMEALQHGHGIPAGIPGVWTNEDDKNLFPQFGPSFRAVKKKHGKDRVKARIEYLKNNQSN